MNTIPKNILCYLLSFVLFSACKQEPTKTFKNSTNQSAFIDTSSLNDGPYVFINAYNLEIKKITQGKVSSETNDLDAYVTRFYPSISVYKDIDTIVALSDVHGQHDLALKILQNNQVIDLNHHWNLGKGHFVICGDIFDRGPKVTDFLWFIYHLEKEAEKAGGKVHFLLGNHEFMVLNNDRRYIHPKYKITEKLLDKTYGELFGKETVLGRWIRSKSTILKINDNLFMHGGISETFLEETFDIESINDEFRNAIGLDPKAIKGSSFYKRYLGKNSPIWYRGYFKNKLSPEQIDGILNQLDVQHIIVGHTSQKKVKQLYNHKIYAVDSSIKNGEYGEILIIENGVYTRGTMYGERVAF
ncbi:MAG: metallophosphoesterase [Flavobacteriaceae bacterium]|nr:MAG: metallophosphoesterase [Flavobacteriaceae bacterium]